MLSVSRELLWIASAQMPIATSSFGASNAVLCLSMLQAMRASLFASPTAALIRCMRSRARQPIAEAEVRPTMWAHHDDPRRLNEQHPQISAAAFSDAAEDLTSSGAVLPGNQPHPSRKITPAIKCLSSTDGSDHCRRDHQADAGHCHDVDAVLFGLADLFNLRGHLAV